MTDSYKYYHQRKEQGLCVKCGAQAIRKSNGQLSTFCEYHLKLNRSVKYGEKMPDIALPCAYEPPRAPYQADYMKNLPELPKDCPRCKAQLFPSLMEVDVTYLPAVQCVNCGFAADGVMWRNKLEGAA